jgi:hypothetical protein
LQEFEPMLRRVLASPKQSLYKAATVLKPLTQAASSTA